MCAKEASQKAAMKSITAAPPVSDQTGAPIQSTAPSAQPAVTTGEDDEAEKPNDSIVTLEAQLVPSKSADTMPVPETVDVSDVADKCPVSDEGHTFLAKCTATFQRELSRHTLATGKQVLNALISAPPSSGLVAMVVGPTLLEHFLSAPEEATLEDGMAFRRVGFYRDGHPTFTCDAHGLKPCFKDEGESMDLLVWHRSEEAGSAQVTDVESDEKVTAVSTAAEHRSQEASTVGSTHDRTVHSAPVVIAPTQDNVFIAKCCKTFHKRLTQYASHADTTVRYAVLADPGTSARIKPLLVAIVNIERYQAYRAMAEPFIITNGCRYKIIGYYSLDQTEILVDEQSCRAFFVDNGEVVDMKVCDEVKAEAEKAIADAKKEKKLAKKQRRQQATATAAVGKGSDSPTAAGEDAPAGLAAHTEPPAGEGGTSSGPDPDSEIGVSVEDEKNVPETGNDLTSLDAHRLNDHLRKFDIEPAALVVGSGNHLDSVNQTTPAPARLFLDKCANTIHRYVMQHTLETGERVRHALLAASDPTSDRKTLLVCIVDPVQFQGVVITASNGGDPSLLGYYHNDHATLTRSAEACRPYFSEGGEQVHLRVWNEEQLAEGKACLENESQTKAPAMFPQTTSEEAVYLPPPTDETTNTTATNKAFDRRFAEARVPAKIKKQRADTEEDLIDLTAGGADHEADGEPSMFTEKARGESKQASLSRPATRSGQDHAPTASHNPAVSHSTSESQEISPTDSRSGASIPATGASVRPARYSRMTLTWEGSQEDASLLSSSDSEESVLGTMSDGSVKDFNMTGPLESTPSTRLLPTSISSVPSAFDLTQLNLTDGLGDAKLEVDHEDSPQQPLHDPPSFDAESPERAQAGEVFSEGHDSPTVAVPNAVQHMAPRNDSSEAEKTSSFCLQFENTTGTYLQDYLSGSWCTPLPRPGFHDLQVAIVFGKPTTLRSVLQSPFTSEELRSALRRSYLTLQQTLARSAVLQSQLQQGIGNSEGAALRPEGRISSLYEDDELFDVPAEAAKKTIVHLCLVKREAADNIAVMETEMAKMKERRQETDENERRGLEAKLETAVEAIGTVCWMVVLVLLFMLCKDS